MSSQNHFRTGIWWRNFNQQIVAAFVLFAPYVVSAQQDQVTELEEVVVLGVKQQLLEAAELERQSDAVISVITADDIGQFPDQNIAESLQRVPGVTITRDEGEGRYVSVRGVNKSYVQVTVNDASIGSSEGSGPDVPPSGDRSVALDVIPSDLLSKVEVGKTLLPDDDAASLGAKIDLRPLSAFDRADDRTGKILVQATHTELAGETKPKIAGDYTMRRTTEGGGEFGVAAAFNYFERAVQVDRLQTDSSGGLESVDGVLVPRELDQRVETGQRDRLGGTLTLDYRDDSSEYNFSVLYGRLEDDDIRVQQEVELRDASGSERIINGSGSGRFSDVDIERQIFFQPRDEETYAIHFEGKNDLNDTWQIAYGIDYSENEFTLTDGLRGRYRERDSIIDATWTRDSADWTYIGNGDFNSGGDEDFDFRPGPEDFEFDGFLIIDERRTDEILSYNIDLEHVFAISGQDARLKFGGKQIKRERVFLRGEDEVNIDDFFDQPGGEFLPQTLADIDTFVPDSGLPLSGGLPGGAYFANLEDFRSVLTQAADFTGLAATERRRDFTVDEDIDAGYLMMDYAINDRLSVIAGVRVERTDYQTTGDVTREASLRIGDNPSQDVTLPGDAGQVTANKKYTEWLPSVHFRYEPNDDVVTRFSVSRAQVRPGFGAATGLRNISFELAPNGDENCNVGDQVLSLAVDGTPTEVCVIDAELDGGNPNLDPLIANQIDFNMGWYPDEQTTLTLALFYKDLEDVFLSTNGGGAIDAETGIEFTDFNGTINGEQGSLAGIEVAFNRFFGNFFASGNLSLMDGEVSDPNLRDGEKFRLPGQSEIVANLSVGFETEDFLVRLSGNHRGDQLSSINTSDSRLDDEDLSAKDVIRDDFTTLDLTFRYNINDQFQFYTDISNINEAESKRYYRGDENGQVFERVEDFGRTYTVGVIGKF